MKTISLSLKKKKKLVSFLLLYGIWTEFQIRFVRTSYASIDVFGSFLITNQIPLFELNLCLIWSNYNNLKQNMEYKTLKFVLGCLLETSAAKNLMIR